MKSIVRIGTRGSALAMYQAELVKTKLENDFPLVKVKLVIIKTSGDMIRRGGISLLETKRIYTREIEEALLKDQVDIAVHSAKDIAVELPAGTEIGAVLEREDARDCLVTRDKKILSELPMGARIGTSSLRRKKQLLRWNSDLIVEEIHGNVDTRVKKLEEGTVDAVCLAYAGMKRLGLAHLVTEVFPESEFYPAPGQGIIVAQCRGGDKETEEVLEPLHHKLSGLRLDCERAFLRHLEGGCQLPCGISSHIEGSRMQAKGALFPLEGHEWVEAAAEGEIDRSEKIGFELAESILQAGGKEILEKIRHADKKTIRE